MKDRSARQPRGSELYLRMLLALAYGLVAFVALAAYYKHDPFCHSTGSFVAAVFTLTLAITALNSIASLCARAFDHFLTPSVPYRLIAPAVCGAIVGFELFCLPFWIYPGYGHFRFEGTVADVSCLFTEGYGVVFPYIATPFFSILSLVRELILERALRSKQSAQFRQPPV